MTDESDSSSDYYIRLRIMICTCSYVLSSSLVVTIWQQSNVIRPIPTIIDDTLLSKQIINGQDSIWNGFYCQSRSKNVTSITAILHHRRWCKMSPFVINKPSNCFIWSLNMMYLTYYAWNQWLLSIKTADCGLWAARNIIVDIEKI